MKNVHLVITDLFLPKDFASEACSNLHLPGLEKLLARGRSKTIQAVPLENWLCRLFGISGSPIAAVSAAFDRLPVNYATGEGWLRADPVHLRLQREQLVLLPNVEISMDEAAQMCASLNRHFADEGMEFFAPHPQRWYLKLARLPEIETVPLSQAAGHNVHDLLPKGREAMRWHQLFNEIQMLLFAHPVNEVREARGGLPINSVWLWGGENTGLSSPLQKAYDCVCTDDVLPEMFAAAANIPFTGWAGQWSNAENIGRQLLFFGGLRLALQHGDLAAWREAIQNFETGYAQPLWQALRSGKISQLQIDILGEHGIRHVCLTRKSTWAFWQSNQPLNNYC